MMKANTQTPQERMWEVLNHKEDWDESRFNNVVVGILTQSLEDKDHTWHDRILGLLKGDYQDAH